MINNIKMKKEEDYLSNDFEMRSVIFCNSYIWLFPKKSYLCKWIILWI